MITMEEHVEENAEAIEHEAQLYAKEYGVTIEEARRDVADEYRQGWCESVEAARTTDWDYGRE